jgi:hypothetical protein
MAKKLSQLTPAGTLVDDDLVLVSVGGATPQSRKATVAQVRGTPRVTLLDETTDLGEFHTLKFVGSVVTVTETAEGEATVTFSEGAGGTATHLCELTIAGKPGSPGVSTTLRRFVAPMSMTIPANFAGSRAFAEIPATANTVIYINKNGTNIGNVTFYIGSQVGTWSATPSSASVSLVAGDFVRIYTGTTQDATLAELGITLVINK